MKRATVVTAASLLALIAQAAMLQSAGAAAVPQAAGSAAVPQSAGSAATPPNIVIDGRFDDWRALEPAWTDPTGDNGGQALDLGRLWIASDAGRIYICFETGVEMGLQSGNGLMLLVDGDDDASTGRDHAGMGVDLEWRFGQRGGAAYDAAGERRRVEQSDIGLRQGPTVTSDVFEISLRRAALPPGDRIRVALAAARGTEGDRLPDAAGARGGGVLHVLSDVTPAPTEPLSLDRPDPTDLRIVTYNVLFDGLFKRPAPFIRLLRALDPDVICFQEIWSHTAQQAVDQVSLALPGGAPWFGGSTEDGLIVSRYPVVEGRSIDDAGNYWAMVDLPDSLYDADLSLVSAHPPCCENEEGRQEELDGIAAWLRDRRSDGTIPPGTFIVIAGDMNLVGSARQVETLVAGAIADEERFGRAAAPDWDGTQLADAAPLHIGGRESYTWRDDTSLFAPGRLDYVVYSDSVMEMTGGFVLRTEDLPDETLARHGLRRTDTGDASDHLPVVADFRARSARE